MRHDGNMCFSPIGDSHPVGAAVTLHSRNGFFCCNGFFLANESNPH